MLTITTFNFSGVIRRKTGENPLLVGSILLHFDNFDTYFGFFSTIRKILKLYKAGVHTKIFVGSEDEKAIARAALLAIASIISKKHKHYLMRKVGCNDKQLLIICCLKKAEWFFMKATLSSNADGKFF